MNIFSRLFGLKSKKDSAVSNDENTNNVNTPPFEQTGLAEPPEQELHDKATMSTGFMYTRPVAIREFLSKDYRMMAEQDALLNPTAEMRNQKISSIGKRFRFTLEQVMQQVEAQVELLQQNIILMGDVSTVIHQQQQNRLRQLRNQLDKLNMQAELSIDEEGWIAPVLSDYKEGFILGALRYQREKELLSGINTLT